MLDIKKIISKLKSFAMIIIIILYLTSIITYSPLDPSFNTINFSNNRIENYIGVIGSYISDISLQTFGLGIVFPIISLLNYNMRILIFNKMEEKLRILIFYISLMISLLLICLFLSFFQKPSFWEFSCSTGGFIGDILNKFILSLYGIYYKNRIFILVSSLLLVFILINFICIWKSKIHVESKKNGSNFKNKLLLIFKRTKKNKDKETFKNKISYKENNESIKEITREDFISSNDDDNGSLKEKINIKWLNKGRNIDNERYELPDIDVLSERPITNLNRSRQQIDKKEVLKKSLEEFGINGEIGNSFIGPIVTTYEFKPSPGIKVSRIIGLASDIARLIQSSSIRISLIEGKDSIGIEIPNIIRETVYLFELLKSKEYLDFNGSIPIVLGKCIFGNPVIADLSKMPHLLISGTTGSGKSNFINSLILSILYKLSPSQCQFIMIDPKVLELSIYNEIPHLLHSVVTDPKSAVDVLKWAVNEMENRYYLMANIGAKNLCGFNLKLKENVDYGKFLKRQIHIGFDSNSGKPIFKEQILKMDILPYIVIIIEEMADLMLVAGKEVESLIQRMSQMARASGIHLIISTQRPSVDIITGTIKANFPNRISFNVASKIDSRTILGENGAEQLLGQGDMLYMKNGNKIHRIHGPFCTDSDISKIVNFLKDKKYKIYNNSPKESTLEI